MRSDTDVVTALAGVFQAAYLTQQVARTGRADDTARSTLLFSLLQVDADDVPAVFGGLSGLRIGLECLRSQLIPGPQRDMEITRYAVSLMQVERRLNRDRDRLAALAADIEALVERHRGFGLDDETLQTQCEDIYRRHISSMGSQIMVKGEPVYLQNPRNAALIRALLLGGIRCAHLWRQCGGSRLQLVFRRRVLLDAVGRALVHVTDT